MTCDNISTRNLIYFYWKPFSMWKDIGLASVEHMYLPRVVRFWRADARFCGNSCSPLNAVSFIKLRLNPIFVERTKGRRKEKRKCQWNHFCQLIRHIGNDRSHLNRPWKCAKLKKKSLDVCPNCTHTNTAEFYVNAIYVVYLEWAAIAFVPNCLSCRRTAAFHPNLLAVTRIYHLHCRCKSTV